MIFTLELVLLKVKPCESLNFHQSVAELNLFDVCAHAFSSPATLFLFLSVSKIQSGGALSDPRMHWSRWEDALNSPSCTFSGLHMKCLNCDSKYLMLKCHWWRCFFCFVFLISVAGSILSKMDQSVNPCEDFYAFSCGGWLKENPIPEDSSSYGIYPWLRQHVDIRLKGLRINSSSVS